MAYRRSYNPGRRNSRRGAARRSYSSPRGRRGAVRGRTSARRPGVQTVRIVLEHPGSARPTIPVGSMAAAGPRKARF
jgi:hypothetical protein